MSQYSTKRFFFTLAMVLFATVFMYCKPWKNKSPEERAETITKRISKELDLTPTQITTLTKIKVEMLAKHKADKAERDAQYKTLIELVKGPTIDRSKLSELKKRHVAMRDTAEELFLDKIIELHKVLTPEQRVRAGDALTKHEKKFSGEK